MKRRLIWLLTLALPALIALAIVALESPLTEWAKQRESILPVAVFVLLAAMLHPRFRHLLVSTLCYGVAFLALRDMLTRHVFLPPSLDYENIVRLRSLALFSIAVLAGIAGIAETIRPGTVWARRCYFIASALYFSGIGVINLLIHPSWVSIVLTVTGVIALFGVIFAPRIVAEGNEEDEEVALDDEVLQQQREEKHRLALHAKEWQDGGIVKTNL